MNRDDLIEFVNARLDEDEAAANAATWCPDAAAWEVVDRGELNQLTGKPRSRTLHDVRYVLVDSLDDRVTGIDAEASDDGGIAAHIARHDPARVLREVEADRKLLAAYAEVADMDREDPEPEFAYGRAAGLGEAVRLRVAIYSDHPDYRQEWRP